MTMKERKDHESERQKEGAKEIWNEKRNSSINLTKLKKKKRKKEK